MAECLLMNGDYAGEVVRSSLAHHGRAGPVDRRETLVGRRDLGRTLLRQKVEIQVTIGFQHSVLRVAAGKQGLRSRREVGHEQRVRRQTLNTLRKSFGIGWG